MSNTFEFNDRMVTHPGYYVQELVEDSGLSQEDYARRLGTTPKNLSLLIRGEQSLSAEMALKLSKMLGTSLGFWLNLQRAYEEKMSEVCLSDEMAYERKTFDLMDYTYYREHCGLPALPHQTDAQIEQVRQFLSVGSLSVLEKKDLMTRGHTAGTGAGSSLSRSGIVNSNAMLQIGINQVLKAESPCYDRRKFLRTADTVLAQEANADGMARARETLLAAGVVLTALPHMPHAAVAAASKRVNGRVLLLVDAHNGRESTFWGPLCREVKHLIDGEFGISYTR